MKLSGFSHMTILLADDHPPFRKGVYSILRGLKFDGVILEAGDGHETINLSMEHTVNLYILDHSMPRLNGYEAAKTVLKVNPLSKIIMMSMHDEPELISSYYEIGVHAFLNKNTLVDDVETTLIKVLNGWDISHPVDQEQNIPFKNSAIHFTKREKELIMLLAQGLTTEAIAKELGLTPKTVETYRCWLLKKVNVKNTTELLHYAHRNGII